MKISASCNVITYPVSIAVMGLLATCPFFGQVQLKIYALRY